MLKVKQIRGSAKIMVRQRETLKGLGLRKAGNEVVLQDTPSIRGMIDKVSHLVRCETVKK